MGSWWPLAEHSVGQADATGCAIEPGVGGRLYETGKDGLEHLWGRVVVWEPPRRLAHSWHPGRQLTERTMVLVTFTPLAPDRTRLTLTTAAGARATRPPRGLRRRLGRLVGQALRRADREAFGQPLDRLSTLNGGCADPPGGLWATARPHNQAEQRPRVDMEVFADRPLISSGKGRSTAGTRPPPARWGHPSSSWPGGAPRGSETPRTSTTRTGPGAQTRSYSTQTHGARS